MSLSARSESYARQVLQAGVDLGISPRGIVIAFATVYVESNWLMYANHGDPESLRFPHDAIGSDHNSVGLFQQRSPWWGTVADRMDPYRSAVLFFNALKRYDYNDLSRSPGSFAQRVQQSAFPDRYDQRIAESQRLYDRLVGGASKGEMTEKRLDYDRSTVPQETGWWCGPASAQIVLQARGVLIPEREIAAAVEQIENPGRGDDRDGTDYVGLIEKYLDQRVPEARYTSVYMPKDPPTKAQRDRLWNDLKRSIDAGWGVVANIVAPPNNPPAATKGSVPPPYPRWTTTYHYVALMGYDDNPNNRAVWVADPAAFGGITGWWCPFEGRGSISSLIPPKGYAFSEAVVAAPPVVVPKTDPVAELTKRVEKLTEALTVLLRLIEDRDPELLRAYLEATKGN